MNEFLLHPLRALTASSALRPPLASGAPSTKMVAGLQRISRMPQSPKTLAQRSPANSSWPLPSVLVLQPSLLSTTLALPPPPLLSATLTLLPPPLPSATLTLLPPPLLLTTLALLSPLLLSPVLLLLLPLAPSSLSPVITLPVPLRNGTVSQSAGRWASSKACAYHIIIKSKDTN